MINAPQNNLIIQIATTYTKYISKILRVAAIENISSIDPVDLVQIVGTVISLPKKIRNNKKGYEGFSMKDIQIGDAVIFRYDVISAFNEVTKGEKSFKNIMWYNGQEYWLCDIKKVFGVIRNGEIIMVNGYVMLSDFEESKIVLPTSAKQLKGVVKSEVLHINNPKENLIAIDVNNGDYVFYSPIIAQKYEIKDKKFVIVTQSQILGKESLN